MSGAALAGLAAFFMILVILAATGAAMARPKARRQARPRYCTKHVIRKPVIPGGPEHLAWVHGPHRTPGNACDGDEHRRRTGWW